MAGSFLQTSEAQVLKKLVLAQNSMDDYDREELTSFLSGSSGYAPASGQITGILKQMKLGVSRLSTRIQIYVATDIASVASIWRREWVTFDLFRRET